MILKYIQEIDEEIRIREWNAEHVATTNGPDSRTGRRRTSSISIFGSRKSSGTAAPEQVETRSSNSLLSKLRMSSMHTMDRFRVRILQNFILRSKLTRCAGMAEAPLREGA